MKRILAVVAMAVAGGTALTASAYAGIPAHESASRPAASAAAPDSAAYRCLIWKKKTANYQGWTAGYSWAWNVTVAPGATGDRVREIQCLTDFWIGKPRALDGVYGNDTKEAVAETQALLGTSPDGIVGPATWRAMRTTPHD